MQRVKVVSKAELARIEDHTSVVVSKAGRLVVASVAQENKAYDVLRQIKVQLKMIEAKRTAITKPLNQSLKEANAMFKTLAAPLKEAEKLIGDKVLEFKLVQEEKAAREQAKKEKIQASHRARGHKTHELVPVVADTGSSVTQKRWVYDLVDIKKVPAKYLELQLGVVRKAIDAGERRITGLKIYQKASLSVR